MPIYDQNKMRTSWRWTL